VKHSRESGSFLFLLTLGHLIAFSPIAGILFDIKPVPMIFFFSLAMSVWILACLFLWVREHRKHGYREANRRVGATHPSKAT